MSEADAENGHGNGNTDAVQQVSELLDRLVMGSKDDPAELGYTVAVVGTSALEKVRRAASITPRARQRAQRSMSRLIVTFCSLIMHHQSQANGILLLPQANVMPRLMAALDDAGNATAREGALLAIKGLVANVGKAAEPYVVPLIATVLERAADKVPSVRDAAAAVCSTIGASICSHAVPLILPAMYEAMAARNWQTKEAALKLLKQLAETAKPQVAQALPEIVPTAGECLVDAREQVKKAAWTAMSAAFKLNGNKDIAPCVPAMLSCIAHPNEVGDTITKLSATTFVQVMRPLGGGREER